VLGALLEEDGFDEEFGQDRDDSTAEPKLSCARVSAFIFLERVRTIGRDLVPQCGEWFCIDEMWDLVECAAWSELPRSRHAASMK